MAAQMPPAQELGAVFARVSGSLLSRETVDTALRLITAVAKEAFPGSSGAGITLLDEHGRRVTSAATDALVEEVDILQYQLEEGPCLAAWHLRTVVRIDDVRTDPRWPSWAQAAADTGMRASLSAPMVAGDEALGALKVYAARPAAYGEREERLLPMFATQAAIWLANARAPRRTPNASAAR